MEEFFLKEIASERAVKLAEHIAQTKDTVRKTASIFGISKSTVHKDVTQWNGGSRLREPPF
jgi:putative DeoR family transcriptional regulator (stage III sporulation protein D)